MIKFLTFSILLVGAVRGRVVHRKTAPCPPGSCDASRCPSPPTSCSYGLTADRCGCCSVCAAGEGESCGEGTAEWPVEACGDGLVCGYAEEGNRSERRHACVCVSTGPVCGSDGRTYPSICRLRAENRRAEAGRGPSVILMERGQCGAGKTRYLYVLLILYFTRVVTLRQIFSLLQMSPGQERQHRAKRHTIREKHNIRT